MRTKTLCGLGAVLAILVLAGCSPHASPGNSTGSDASGSGADLTILSGSENKTLEPILQRFSSENHVTVKMDYRGSVDIMMLLQSGEVGYDAVWPANKL